MAGVKLFETDRVPSDKVYLKEVLTSGVRIVNLQEYRPEYVSSSRFKPNASMAVVKKFVFSVC